MNLLKPLLQTLRNVHPNAINEYYCKLSMLPKCVFDSRSTINKKRFNDKDLFYFSLEAFVRKYEFRVTY